MKLIKKLRKSLGVLLMISLIIPIFSFPKLTLANGGDFIWAKSIGGIGWDEAYSITTDSAGNVYTTGRFEGTADFDPGPGTFNLSSLNADIFVSKLDSDGNFVWARSMGGAGWDEAFSITTDSAGNVYTTGSFDGTADFDPGAGVFNLTSTGLTDIFISKLDSDGNFVWARSMGGTSNDVAYSITTDSDGNVYTTGSFMGTVDFDPGAGVFNLIGSAGNGDIFISKLNSDGNFVWARSMGGAGWDEAFSITTDSSGNVYTTGYFQGPVDFDPGAGTFNLSSLNSDIFISKLNSDGNFVWARSMGGTSSDLARSITTDSFGNVYTTGSFRGTADFDPGAGTFNLSSVGDPDIFISKLDSSGNFVWAKSMGGTGWDEAFSITTDLLGNVYTVGKFQVVVDFDPGAGIYNLNSAGGNDTFISKLDSSGNFVWSKRMGGTGGDWATSITTNSSGNIYTTGYFQGTVDFDPGAGTFNLSSAGGSDIFILKLTGFVFVADIFLSSYSPGALAVFSELSFINQEDIPVGGIITIDIPSEFTVGDIPDLRDNVVAFTDDGVNVSVTAASSTNNKVELILGSAIDAFSNIIISFDDTLIDQNPIAAGSYEFSVKNYDAGWNEIYSRNASVNISLGALSNESITLDSIVPSSTAIESTFSFTTQNTVPANGYIEITISNDFSAGNTDLSGHISTFTADSVPVAYTGSLNTNLIVVRPSSQIAGGSDIVLTFDDTIIDQNPSDAGNYEFLINTYDSNHTKNDEGSATTYIGFELYYIDSWNNILYKINATDLTTISSSEISTDTGQPISGSGGSAVDPSTNEVYTILQLQFPNGRFLTKLNMETNVATVIGNMNSNFSSLAFDESGQLYGLTGDGDLTNPSSLFTINKTNASKTLLASYDVNWDGEALTYNNEDHKLYRATGDDMYAINPADPENPETIFEDNADLFRNSSTALFHKGGNEYYYISYSDVYNLNISTQEAVYFTQLDSGAKNLFELGPASGACSNTSVRFSADPNPIADQTTLCATGEAMQIQAADANSPWTYYCAISGTATSTQCTVHRADGEIDYSANGPDILLATSTGNKALLPNYKVRAITATGQSFDLSNAAGLGDKSTLINGTSIESALSALKGGAAISTVDKAVIANGEYAQANTTLIVNSSENMSYLLQDETTFYGETSSWNQKILAPQDVTSLTNVNGLYARGVLRIGATNEPIVFDKAARLELPIKNGTPMYSSDGGVTWNNISACTDATLDSAGSLTFPSECFIRQDKKTYIWTYHFTDFGTFTIEPTLTFDNLFPGRNPGETRLEFTPTLTIPAGGSIELTIPSRYTANDIADLTSNITTFTASGTNPGITSSNLTNNIITIVNTAQINALEPVVIVFDNTVINTSPVTTSRYTFNLKTYDNLSALQDYGNINIDLVARFMADLTADANYNDGLANGEGLDDYGLVTGEPEVNINSTNDVYFSQFNRYGNFLASDSVLITVPAGWSVENCGTPTTDVDADGTVDGSMSFTSSTTALYTFSSPTTLATSTGLEFCLSVTSDNNPGNEIITITSSSTIPETGAVFIYNGERNEVFVTAEVYESLYFQIRDSVDANPTSVCDLGVLNTGQVKECSYRLAVETNAADGFSLFINDVSTNPGLTANSGIDNIDPVTENQVVTAGQEGYGISLTNATSTIEQGDFTDDDTAIPTIKTALISATNPYDWQQGTTTTSSLVTHRAAISAATAGGNYTQTVAYYVTANY